MPVDLVKTINDDDEVPNMSEDSESDDDGQPKKNRIVKLSSKDFDNGFKFVGSQKEYMKDTWNDVAKYCRKTASTTIDDKIAKLRKERKKNEGETVISDDDVNDSGDSLSDDEMVADNVKVKERDAQRKAKRKLKGIKQDTGIQIEVDEGTADSGDEGAISEEEESFFADAPAYDESASFTSMNLSRPLMKAIEDMKFVHPTPIQSATIPVALSGRDICGCAATGTGKTAAYMLPVLERLLYKPKNVAVTRVLVLVPTRELGVQVYQVTKQLAQFSSIAIAMSVGGLDLKLQESLLRKNPDVVIATPGRLIDHIKNTPTFTLETIEVLILDEADRMLEESFFEQMKEIIKSCAKTRQTLLFSATMTDQVNKLAAVSLKKPVKIFVDSNKVVAWNLRQEFVRLRTDNEADREALLATLVCRTFRDHCMVFIRTKAQCHRLHVVLGLLGVRVGELHGNMTQPQRLQALKQFKDEELDILLATDVAARGLDIKGVKTVINFTMPYTIDHYTHRVGRTARAGRSGRSVSIASEAERKMVREIIRRARDPVKSRVIPPEIVDKYRKKLASIDIDVKTVLREEMAEKELAGLEKRANMIDNRLQSNASSDNWHNNCLINQCC
jgi:ATP-dependent RNA helicase DDX27